MLYCSAASAVSQLSLVDLLRELSEKESDGGELSCSNLESDEDMTLCESNCEEPEESADEVHNIPTDPNIYVARRDAIRGVLDLVFLSLGQAKRTTPERRHLPSVTIILHQRENLSYHRYNEHQSLDAVGLQ
ncbi:hypothetical protein TNCV_2578891 [Trichonephila clavipes]|nr:hypothetical protein TNCV_2578891 [Trichonephila clavipes]